ncbi:MAG: cell division protein FtsQ/DivIB [Actinomycetota bacterium]
MSRRSRNRKRLPVRAIIALVVIAGAAFGAYQLTGSRLFALSGIDVVGASAKDAVIAASGLHPGQSVMHLDLDAVASRIEALPDVASARVERVGSVRVRITVVERVAALELSSGARQWFVDGDGIPVDAPPTRRVPVVRAPAFDENKIAPEFVGSVLSLWRALPAELRARIDAFEPDESGIAFTLSNGTRVLLGGPNRLQDKLEALDAVSARVVRAGKRLLSVDLRAPNHPTARLG